MAKKPKVLHHSENGWELLQDSSGLMLDVMVGTVALYMARLRLNEAEKAAYEKRGNAYLDELAADIVRNEPKYREQGRTTVVP